MDKKKGLTQTDAGIKQPKVRKLGTTKSQDVNQSQTQTQRQSQSQPTSELISRTRRIDPMDDNLDELVQVWNQAQDNPNTLSEDQIELLELKKYLAQIEQENRDIQARISKKKAINEKMADRIEEKVQARQAIVEKQNVVADLSSTLRDHMDALTDELIQTEEELDRLEGLYDASNAAAEQIIQVETARLKELVSKNQELEAEFNTTAEELIIAKARREETRNKMIKETERIEKGKRKLEESAAMIERNEEEYNRQMAEKTASKKLLDQSLKAAQEENSQLGARYKESVKEIEELVSEVEKLEAEDAASANEVELLKSKLLEKEALDAKLKKDLDEANKANVALASDGDAEVAEYRKQVRDLMSKNAEATEHLEELISDNEKHLKTLAEATRHEERLKKAIENKDNEIKKYNKEVSDASKRNMELLASIEDLKEELATAENVLRENRAAFETQKTEQNAGNEKKNAALRAEVAAAEKLLSEKSDQLTKMVKMSQQRKIDGWTKINILEEDISRKKKIVDELRKSVNHLQSVKTQKQLEAQRTLPNHCQRLGHVDKLKEQGKEIESLNKQLSAEKLKLMDIKLKNKEAERREIDKKNAEDKEHKARVDDLKKTLAELEEEIEDLQTEENEDQADREAIPKPATPKSILRLGSKSPLRNQKVQFDLKKSVQTSVEKADSSSTIEDGQNRSATPATEEVDLPASSQPTGTPSATSYYSISRAKYRANAPKPSWVKIDFPTSSQEPQTPAQADEVIPSSQTQKSESESANNAVRAPKTTSGTPASSQTTQRKDSSDAVPKPLTPRKFFKSKGPQ